MASYRVIDPSLEKLSDLARITKNLRFYEDQFRRYKDHEDEKKADKYRADLDKWHKDWLERID